MCAPALTLISGLISGIGAAAQASAQAASHKAAAEAQRRQAQIETITGAYKAERQQDQVDRVLGSQRASFAAGGLSMSGSPSDLVIESAQEGALDVAAIRWSSSMQAQTHNYNAKIEDMNARSAKRAAPIAFLTPVLGAVTNVARYQSSFGG